jgi:lipid-binding SYLF domain-containing protein
MKFPKMVLSSFLVTWMTAGLCSAGDTPDQKRTNIRKMAAETLDELYKAQPSAKGAIQASVGYAVFDNFSTKILLVTTAHGSGLAVKPKSGQETFMKMISAGAGLGIGVKDYSVIFAFENDQAKAKFLNSGWSGSAEADAAAKTSKSGGAYAGAARVDDGVWAYQLTKKGLALDVTLQGTKYSKDDKLNNPDSK